MVKCFCNIKPKKEIYKMKRKTRIISFVLSLALLIGCMPTAIFAEREGGSEADTSSAEVAEALSDKIPDAYGIMSAEEIAALIGDANVAASNPCDTVGRDTNNFQSVIDDSAGGGRKYIKVHESTYTTDGDGNKVRTTPFSCGTLEETFVQLGSRYTGNHDAVVRNYEAYKGRSIVISTDIRLEAGYSLPERPLMEVRTYLAVNSSGEMDSVGINLINIKEDGTLTVGGTALEKKVNKSTADTEAEFTTVAIHILPEENTYNVYVDGVCQTKDFEPVLISEEQEKLLTFKDAKYKTGGTTVTVSAEGHKDFTFGWARFMHIYSNYHGEDCPDGCIYAGKHKASCPADCTSTHNYEDMYAPFNFDGDQFSLDNMKAYYSDFYLECTEHDIAVGAHTHNEDDLSAHAVFTCNNCLAEWDISVPMDQTGNALCDLCEIENAGGTSDFHSTEKIKELIKPTLGELYILDGSGGFSKSSGSDVAVKHEGENAYYVIGSNASELFHEFGTGDFAGGRADTLNKFGTSEYKGQSFVVQADIRLGENFTSQNKTVELFKIISFVRNDDETNSQLEMLYPLVAKISGDGDVLIRNGATGSFDSAYRLSESEFTSIALHIKTANSSNACGSFDVYINGELKASDVQFLTADEERHLHFEATLNGHEIKADGIKDFCYSWTRALHTAAGTFDAGDVLHADNFITYYHDTYTDDYTRHDMKAAEHVHDYSKKCVTLSNECALCGEKRNYVAIIDGNGDKVCDICINQKLDSSADGIISPDRLEALLGKSNVILSSSCTANTTSFGFSHVSNSNGCISAKTENGNTFVQYSANKSSGEAYLDVRRNAGGTAMLSNFERDAGRSFIYSIDVRLGKNYELTQSVFQILSYMVPTSTNGKGEATGFTATNCTYVSITADGTLYYRDPNLATGGGVTTSSGYRLEKGAEEFTTLSIHVRPREGEFGLYSLYADGKLIVKDIPFMSAEESAKITWTASNGTTSRGAMDYNLGFIRSFHVMSHNTVKDDFVSVDNPKLYYSDSFAECSSHIFAIEGHEHDLERGEIKIKLKCHCGAGGNEITLPIDTTGDGKCDSCGAHILANGAILTGRQVTVGKYISLKFYTKTDAALASNENAKIIITVNGRSEEFGISESSENENGERVFEIRLTPAEMSAEVKMAVEADGVRGNEYVTSVRDYTAEVQRLTEDEYALNICRAMLNYGASAQEYIASETGDGSIGENPANALLEEKYRDTSYVTCDRLTNHKMKLDGTENGTDFKRAELVLESGLSLKVFFTAPDGFTVSVDGKDTVAGSDGDLYFAVISDLTPSGLDREHTVSVTVGESTRIARVSAFSAIYSLLADGDGSESLKALGRSVYLFGLAAEMYITESDRESAEIVVKDGAKGAVAIVLDDGNQQAANYVAEYLKKYDKTAASFALITSNLATLTKSGGEYVKDGDGKYTYTQTDAQKATAEYWRNYLNETDINGDAVGARIELISHSHTHAAPKDGDNYAELLAPRHILQGLFGYNSEALISPGGFSTDESYNSAMTEIYIGCRGTNASENVYPMLNTLSEFDKLKRKRFDSFMVQYNKMWLNEQGKFSDATISAQEAIKADGDGNADISQVEKFIDSAMENSALAAFCIHGIVPATYNDGTNTSGLHIYEQQAEAIFKYVQKHAETGELWATTYSEAIKYFCEWNTAKLDVRRFGERMISVNVTDGEDDAIFNTELTVKISVDDSWTSAIMIKNGTAEEIEIRGEAGARYVLVNVLPDSGIVTVEGSI